MTHRPSLTEHLALAREKQRANAAHRRASTIFILSYRGSEAGRVVGYKALAAHVNISTTSIPVLLSKGGGVSFDLMRTNPLTGEPDILTVYRVLPAKLPHARRGRPPGPVTLAAQQELAAQQADRAAERERLRNRKRPAEYCAPKPRKR